MSEQHTDLESRLATALRDGSQGAPDALGLAAAARGRARQRRRARVAGAAAAVALAVAVPVGVVTWSGSGGGGSADPDVADTSPDVPPAGAGYRWESWHGVTAQVPDTWDHGALSDWCADGGTIGTPRVQRPGTVAASIACRPGWTYGLTFQEVDDRDDFEWPVVSQTGDAWPDPNVVGARGVGGVLVTVATPDAELAHLILDSVRRIGDSSDPNGCPARLTTGEVTPPEDGLSVCRYDETWALEQSAVIRDTDAVKAVQALRAAPEASECVDSGLGSQPHQVVVLGAAGISARVDLVEGCSRVEVDGDVRDLTLAVVVTALSAGWDGPLPSEARVGLRQQ
jgi:hypothetical protein